MLKVSCEQFKGLFRTDKDCRELSPILKEKNKKIIITTNLVFQFVNSCGFKKQQFWFKDVTVVEKEEQF